MVEFNDKNLTGMEFIDLFAGIGGFRIALESLGAQCVFSSEWDNNARVTYHENFGEWTYGDITQVSEFQVPDHDILCAGFPCQAFSVAGHRAGFEDDRGVLFLDVVRIMAEKRPKVLFMENVRNFESHDGGMTFSIVRGMVEGFGYRFFWKVMNAADYGIPQARERVYMVCFREDLGVCGFRFPEPVKLEKHIEDVLLDDDLVEDLYICRSDTYIYGDTEVYSDRPVRLGEIGRGGQGERIYSIRGAGVTLSANGGGGFAKTGGYLVNGRPRKLHPLECARIMGFPDSYRLPENWNVAYKQFGNSVVVDVVQRIAWNIGNVLREC